MLRIPPAVAGEEQLWNAGLVVFEVTGASIDRCGIRHRTEVHGRLPSQVVVRVLPPGYPEVEVPGTSRPIAREEQVVFVA